MHATQALPGSEIVLIGVITAAVVIALTVVVIGAHWMLFPVHPAVHVGPR